MQEERKKVYCAAVVQLQCVSRVVGTLCISAHGRGGVSVRVGSTQSRCKWLQRLMVQFGFEAFSLVWENELVEAGIWWVS